jgi:hypothetical protein
MGKKNPLDRDSDKIFGNYEIDISMICVTIKYNI